jgi:hypothetical protein
MMAQTKLPAMQWYPGDWRKDAGVQSLDYHDRGVWWELLQSMHESAERGRLVFPTGAPMPDAAIARLLGMEEAEWKQIRSKLVSYGVAAEDDAGVLYNRRMVRDEATRQAKAEAGRKGGLKSRPSKDGSKREAKRGSSVSVSSSEEKKEQKKKRATRLPTDWQPNDIHRQLAKKEGVNTDREADNFRDHATATARTQVDWDAAFRTWLRKASDFGGGPGARTGTTNDGPFIPGLHD